MFIFQPDTDAFLFVVPGIAVLVVEVRYDYHRHFAVDGLVLTQQPAVRDEQYTLCMRLNKTIDRG